MFLKKINSLIGGGAKGRNRAQQLAGSYASAMAISFADNSMIIRHAVTPANNYSGPPFSKLTHSRASIATHFDASGQIVQVGSGTPRFDTTPTLSPVKQRYLHESAATNLLLNSVLAGTNLGNQSVATAAVQYTLSFYGTGTVTLTNSFAGSLVGSGAFPTRSTLTFTAAAGTLDLAVTGTVAFAQLETGAIATSFIPTAGATVTRAADSVTMPLTAFNFSATQNTGYCDSIYTALDQNIMTVTEVTGNNVYILGYTASFPRFEAFTAGLQQAGLATVSNPKAAFSLEANSALFSTGGAPVSDVTVIVPVAPTTFRIGSSGFPYYSALNKLYVSEILLVPQILNVQTLAT